MVGTREGTRWRTACAVECARQWQEAERGQAARVRQDRPGACGRRGTDARHGPTAAGRKAEAAAQPLGKKECGSPGQLRATHRGAIRSIAVWLGSANRARMRARLLARFSDRQSGLKCTRNTLAISGGATLCGSRNIGRLQHQGKGQWIFKINEFLRMPSGLARVEDSNFLISRRCVDRRAARSCHCPGNIQYSESTAPALWFGLSYRLATGAGATAQKAFWRALSSPIVNRCPPSGAVRLTRHMSCRR